MSAALAGRAFTVATGTPNPSESRPLTVTRINTLSSGSCTRRCREGRPPAVRE